MIVRMDKVQVLGPRGLLREAIRFLQAQGILQLRPLPDAPPGPGHTAVRKVPVAGADLTLQRSHEDFSRRLHELLLLLPASREPSADVGALPEPGSPEFPGRLAALESEIRALSARRLALEEERVLTSRYERLLTALVPLLRGLEGVTHVEIVGILVRRERREALALLERELERITRGAYTLLYKELDRQEAGALITVPREFGRDLSRLLFEQGITEVRLPGRYADQSFVATLGLLLRRSRELPAEIARLEADLQRCARRWYEPLRQARRVVLDRLARFQAAAHCGETEHAFVISGWVPSEQRERLATALEAAFQGKVTLAAHRIREEEYGAVPVVLKNPGFVAPFELLLSLLPAPRYGSIDPTPFLAACFPLFFGLMLGDVGYGAIALALALLARKKRWGGETGRKFTAIAVAASSSAIVFGWLFGEFFGELGGSFALPALLLHRKEAVLAFLGLALGLGGTHVALGVGLGLWTALRRGKRAEALARAATLAVMGAAVAGLLARLDYLPAGLGRAALVAIGPLLVGLIVLEGVLAPLEIMKTLGNVLSYARLMALGLASVMLADVANQMAGFIAPSVVGVTVAVLLHAVNFVMGCFSPVIQALRLHYVEFFGKFYEDGGRPYEPFSLAS